MSLIACTGTHFRPKRERGWHRPRLSLAPSIAAGHGVPHKGTPGVFRYASSSRTVFEGDEHNRRVLPACLLIQAIDSAQYEGLDVTRLQFGTLPLPVAEPEATNFPNEAYAKLA